MDIGPALKAAAPPASPVVHAANSATGPLDPGTELTAPRVVLGVGSAAKPGDAPKQTAPTRTLDDVTERVVTIDVDTREIVRQSIDTRTREVVGQSPDQAILGLRAYFDRLAERSAGKASDPRGDGLEIVQIRA